MYTKFLRHDRHHGPGEKLVCKMDTEKCAALQAFISSAWPAVILVAMLSCHGLCPFVVPFACPSGNVMLRQKVVHLIARIILPTWVQRSIGLGAMH